ncbi:MAG: hypothetical protein ACR2IL_02050 [Chitinophagaceae bacterium]
MNSNSALVQVSSQSSFPLIGQRTYENFHESVLEAYIHQPKQYLSLAVFQEQGFQVDGMGRLMINRHNMKRLPFLLGSPRWPKHVLSFTDRIDDNVGLGCSVLNFNALMRVCVRHNQAICVHTVGLPERFHSRECQLLIEKKGLHLVYSMSSIDETWRKQYEPNTPTYRYRLDNMGYWSKQGIGIGLLIFPNGLNQYDGNQYELFRRTAMAGARWVALGSMNQNQKTSCLIKQIQYPNSHYQITINRHINPINRHIVHFGFNRSNPFKVFEFLINQKGTVYYLF